MLGEQFLQTGERIDYLKREGLAIIQSRDVFSFSLDAVLLADFAKIPARRVARIVDLCAGNGAVTFLLSAKTQNKIVGVELQERLVDMAQRSVALNEIEQRVEFIPANIKDLTVRHIAKDSIDFITCNPPYFKVAPNSSVNQKESYAIARHETMLPLETLLTVISDLLKMKGKAYIVHRPDRLADIVTLARQRRMEAKRVQFVHPKVDKESNIVLVELMKDGNAGGMRILPPIVVYDDQQHYSQQVRSILFGEE